MRYFYDRRDRTTVSSVCILSPEASAVSVTDQFSLNCERVGTWISHSLTGGERMVSTSDTDIFIVESFK